MFVISTSQVKEQYRNNKKTFLRQNKYPKGKMRRAGRNEELKKVNMWLNPDMTFILSNINGMCI